MIKVKAVDHEKKTVTFGINGTDVKFALYRGIIVELSRTRDSQILDRANLYIQVEDYNKIRRQAYAILATPKSTAVKERAKQLGLPFKDIKLKKNVGLIGYPWEKL